MARDDWFRRTSWTEVDEAEFHARLKRSRSSQMKSQYLKIQAIHLAEAKQPKLISAALQLLDLLFKEYPERTQLASAHLLAARCHEYLGNNQQSLHHFELALLAQNDLPNVDPGTKIEYPWFVSTKGIVEHFDAALQTLETAHAAFPIQQFKVAAARAFITHKRGSPEASTYAQAALNAASTNESQFQYHKNLGLVGPEFATFLEALREIAIA